MPQRMLQWFLVTLLAASATGEQSMSQEQQLMRMCQDSAVKNACRGLNLRRFQGQSCHDQLLSIVCNVRSLRCIVPASLAPTTMEDPICSQSCQRVFRSCRISELTFIAYVPVNEKLCNELPTQLCADWSRPVGQRDDRAIDAAEPKVDQETAEIGNDTEICQAKSSIQCDKVQYIADIAKRPRRGAGARSRTVRRRHPFKKSDFRDGNFTYAAEVKLARAGWQMAAPIRRPRSLGWPYAGGYEKLLHLEIKKVLYTGSQAIGHILDPGSVQIVVLKSGCACAPLKLNQQLIFVGYNSYLENVWNQVVLLPSNSHYKCKIKRCWRPRGRRNRRRRIGWLTDADRRQACQCPCGRGERLTCSDIQRANRRAQRRQQGGNFWRRRDRTAV
ncbi:hypothetical protein BOX15_Mlig025353g1 [Macrostomum lignano]|uniref:FZ domain-containing protein n=2 Tax=Macrostomum lignano TaxID=282301 RepID=A0A267F3R5_9PLAT|nr:hypothetical protein BOX15_Mlig025353g1 [Macrostomum lignano]